jgi:hypothetical protein
MCKVYIDLQRSDAEDVTMNPPISMRLVGSETNFKWFLRTIYYLRKYPIEEDFKRTLAVNIGWARKNIWRLMQKIQYLKYQRITWPDGFGGEDIRILTVDGTHVWLSEPGHEEFLKIVIITATSLTKQGLIMSLEFLLPLVN